MESTAEKIKKLMLARQNKPRLFKDYKNDEEFLGEVEESEEARQKIYDDGEDYEAPHQATGGKRPNLLDFESIQVLTNYLSRIQLAWPEDLPGYKEKVYDETTEFDGYPRTYFHNSPKEKAVLWHAENYRAQFQFRFPDRRPLLIAPRNEVGFQKLFPTYIKPRLQPYPDLFFAESCAAYFREFFDNVFLQPPIDPPKRIRSPYSVLQDRKANCYEHAIIIATVLLGAGYNAYVVDGYATQDVTMLAALEEFVDNFQEHQDHFTDALIGDKEKSDVFTMADLAMTEDDLVLPVPTSKYKSKVKKHFISAYQEMMQEREDEKKRIEDEKAREEELRLEIENAQPPPVDPLLGFRVHSWVLILPGSRDVEEAFFLEPFTGTRRELGDDAFLGLEAVFNHKNYWVNLQDCNTGVGDLNYDLENLNCWAKFLVEPKIDTKEKKTEETTELTLMLSSLDDEEENEIQIPEMYLDMPVSWTVDFEIPEHAYRMKYPTDAKSFEFRDTMVQKAAAYTQADGFIYKVLKFNGTSRKASDLVFIDERFDKRQDKLLRRKFGVKGRIVHEYFDKGRPDSLKEHIFFAGRNKPHSPRHLFYWPGWHPENVVHRQVLPNRLTEIFEGRQDHLIYRETFFGEVLCVTVPEKLSKTEELKRLAKGDKHRARRVILAVLEKYSRNTNHLAHADIAERHLLISAGKIRLVYHYAEETYTRGTLEFWKPESTSKLLKDAMKFGPEHSKQFLVDPFDYPWDNYKKALVLKEVLIDQPKICEKSQQAEEEICKTVEGRVVENWYHKLDNEVQEARRAAQDEVAIHEHLPQSPEEDEDIELDFASPYLVWGEPEDKEEEICLKRHIMEDAKNRISRMAEYIITCYQEESKQLKRILNQGCTELETSVAESENYTDCFQRTLNRLHVLERKLLRFQAKAPRDYCNLLIQVLLHPTLNRFALEEEEELLEEEERIENIKLLELLKGMKARGRRSCCNLDYAYVHGQRHEDDDSDEDEIEEIQERRATIKQSPTSVEGEVEEEDEDEDEEAFSEV